MKKQEFRNMVREIIREELKSIMHPSEDHIDPHKDPHLAHEGTVTEKSVPQPYDRKSARKMTKSQIERRQRIGKAMEDDEKVVSKFRRDHGDEWKDYLWRAATAATFREK